MGNPSAKTCHRAARRRRCWPPVNTQAKQPSKNFVRIKKRNKPGVPYGPATNFDGPLSLLARLCAVMPGP